MSACSPELELAFGGRLDGLVRDIVRGLQDAGLVAKALSHPDFPARREIEIFRDRSAPGPFAAAVIELYMLRSFFQVCLDATCLVYKQPVGYEFTVLSEQVSFNHKSIDALMEKMKAGDLGAAFIRTLSGYLPATSPKHWLPTRKDVR